MDSKRLELLALPPSLPLASWPRAAARSVANQNLRQAHSLQRFPGIHLQTRACACATLASGRCSVCMCPVQTPTYVHIDIQHMHVQEGYTTVQGSPLEAPAGRAGACLAPLPARPRLFRAAVVLLFWAYSGTMTIQAVGRVRRAQLGTSGEGHRRFCLCLAKASCHLVQPARSREKKKKKKGSAPTSHIARCGRPIITRQLHAHYTCSATLACPSLGFARPEVHRLAGRGMTSDVSPGPPGPPPLFVSLLLPDRGGRTHACVHYCCSPRGAEQRQATAFYDSSQA